MSETRITKQVSLLNNLNVNPIWTGLLRGSSVPLLVELIQPPPPPPSQCLGLYLSVANKTCQIYETNQNKVIDIKKCWHCRMLLTSSKIEGSTQNFGISSIFIKNCEKAKICFQLLQNIK